MKKKTQHLLPKGSFGIKGFIEVRGGGRNCQICEGGNLLVGHKNYNHKVYFFLHPTKVIPTPIKSNITSNLSHSEKFFAKHTLEKLFQKIHYKTY